MSTMRLTESHVRASTGDETAHLTRVAQAIDIHVPAGHPMTNLCLPELCAKNPQAPDEAAD